MSQATMTTERGAFATWWKLALVGVAALVWCAGLPAAVAAPCAAGLLTGPAALGSGWGQDRPGLCRQILPTGLPPPSVSHNAKPQIVPRPVGAVPQLPPGFAANLVHQGDSQLRQLRTAPNGDLFVAASAKGEVLVLPPSGPCTMATGASFAGGLNLPFGMAFYPPGPNPHYVYVAETNRIVRYSYASGLIVATTPPEVVVASLPGGAGELPGKGHWTRDVAFSADGTTMFVSIGSYSNDQNEGEDETNRARILAFDPTGGKGRVMAWGLRNPVSMSISPITGALRTTNNERDELGDNIVPDYVTAVRPGEFFGWPWYYIGAHVDPRHPEATLLHLPPVSIPNVLLQAHSASLGSAFYTGSQFPAEYHGNQFVAGHGSWNRRVSVGAKVIRLVFDPAGNALPYYEDFMTGFGAGNHEVWGRPVGVAASVDGSLYVSEDANNTIWCVRYVGATSVAP
jgi:glucose/arabinose dehydrogenase